MEIITIPFNHFLVNTYLLVADNKETMLIDPACANASEEDKLKSIVADHQLIIRYILFTHTHIDHIAGAEFAKKTFPEAQLLMHKDAEQLYQHADNFSTVMGFNEQNLPAVDGYVEDNQEIKLGNENIKIIHTPGHANGSICIYHQKNKFVVVGDVLLNNSIGRTDLPGGSYDTLINSIKTKLLTLAPETKVFPGHGDMTTIEYEIENNPFL